MEVLKVQLISKETIQPSSPTPQHLRNHKLSLLDQIAPPIYVPILLFYSASEINYPGETSVLLKSSLSKALTRFYPFAGRVKDGYSIDCNDDGATFIEARVDSDLSTVLKEPDMDLLLRLLPCNPYENLPEPSLQVILAVQVNYFACGGMTVSVCFRHVVADASAAASFLKVWAAIATGCDAVHDAVIYDCTSLFPPQDLSGSRLEKHLNLRLLPEVVTRRFVFYGSKILALINEIGSGLCSYRPTRVEAVSSLIWSAVMAADTKQGGEDQGISMHGVCTIVNMRKRINPSLSPLCMGNVNHATRTNLFMANSASRDWLAKKIHESIMKIDDKHVRQIYGSGSYINALMNPSKEHDTILQETFITSSWCKFPFYETDFGWGKPIWFTTVQRVNRTAIFVDTSDSEGIETWIGLTKEEMAKLEQDPGILAYASLNPSIM